MWLISLFLFKECKAKKKKNTLQLAVHENGDDPRCSNLPTSRLLAPKDGETEN